MAQASPDIWAMRRPVVSCSHAPGSLSRAGLGWLWLPRRRPWGCLLAGAIPTTMTLVGVSIVSDTLFEYLNDSKTSLGAAPWFVVVTDGRAGTDGGVSAQSPPGSGGR